MTAWKQIIDICNGTLPDDEAMDKIRAVVNAAKTKWIVVRKQDNGCDHTIECGTAVEAIPGYNHDRKKVIEWVSHWLNPANETVLSETTDHKYSKVFLIHSTDDFQIDMDSLRESWRNENEQKQRQLAEEKERAEWERLNEKYGSSKTVEKDPDVGSFGEYSV